MGLTSTFLKRLAKEVSRQHPPPPNSRLTLNRSAITVYSWEFKEHPLDVLWTCCIKLELSRMLMSKDGFKQRGDLRLAGASANKGAL